MRKLILAVLLAPAIATADETVTMTPGMWEMTMTMKMSMMAQEQTKVENVCIEKDQFDPHDFNMEQDSPCDLSEISSKGNTVSWSVSCPTPGGSMAGGWEFTSHGDTVEGTGQMSAKMGEMAIDMDMDWTGKHTGDC
jgi:hypothetical protein